MCSTREMRERLEAFRSDVVQIAGECMEEHKEEIVQLLIYQQYEENVDARGNPLRPYSPPYLQHKKLSGRTGNTNLNESGQFQEEMNLRVAGDEFEFESPAKTAQGELKSQWLNEWNEKAGGADVMMLTTDNKDRIFPIIEESFNEKVKAYLGV